jgi:hypothetical protein
MKKDSLWYVAAALLGTAWIFITPARTAPQERHISLSFQGSAEHCSDLQVRSSGEIARANEEFTLQKGEAPSLEVEALERGIIKVRGWDRPDYSVEACKIAAAGDRAGAGQLLGNIKVTRSAGRFSYSGPGGDRDEWRVYFIIHAPKDASLDLETKNGPIDIAQVSGTVKARAANGPIAIRESSGTIQARTVNGPISFSGGGGDVQLNAQNGPISLKLAGDAWNGAQLAASTVNGPLSLSLPERFHSGIRVETSAHAPISCRAGVCASASTNATANQRVLQINGSGGPVRISTEHGPVSVNGAGKVPRVI